MQQCCCGATAVGGATADGSATAAGGATAAGSATAAGHVIDLYLRTGERSTRFQALLRPVVEDDWRVHSEHGGVGSL